MNINVKDYKVIIIVFLLGVSIFSVSSYISMIREKRALSESLEIAQAQVVSLANENQKVLQSLEKEKKISQGLSDKNALYRSTLRAGKKRMDALFVEENKAKEELGLLKAENAAVRAEDERLRADLVELTNEKEELSARFNSVSELKKAISELKKQNRRMKPLIKKEVPVAKRAAAPVKPETPQEIKPSIQKETSKKEIIIEGNRGYVIKDGKPVPISSIKIEVNPASKN